jgi:antitoxin CptB
MTASGKLHAPDDKPPGFTGAAFFAWDQMAAETRLKRLRFRAWHRGTREADMLVGGYFDRWHAGWSAAEADWFEAFLEEQDLDIIAWATGTAAVPARLAGEMMSRLQDTGYIRHFR